MGGREVYMPPPPRQEGGGVMDCQIGAVPRQMCVNNYNTQN